MWQRFTERARKAVFYSQVEAQRLGQGRVSPEHLLLGLMHESDSVAGVVLTTLGVSLDQVRLEVEKEIPSSDSIRAADMTLSSSAKSSIDFAYQESTDLKNNYIGTEHLLLGILREKGIAAQVLTQLGAGIEAVRAEVIKLQQPVAP